MKLIAIREDGLKVTLVTGESFEYCKKIADDCCIRCPGLYHTFNFIEEQPDELKEGDSNE